VEFLNQRIEEGEATRKNKLNKQGLREKEQVQRKPRGAITASFCGVKAATLQGVVSCGDYRDCAKKNRQFNSYQ
jgi:hypothetical protein